MDNVGRSIKVLRTSAGVKQKIFAERVGVSAAYLSLVESGRREPTLPLLRRVARELKVPLALLFLMSEDSSPNMESKWKEALSGFVTSILDYQKAASSAVSSGKGSPSGESRPSRKASQRKSKHAA